MAESGAERAWEQEETLRAPFTNPSGPWFVLRGETQLGPLTVNELREALAAGLVSKETLLWHEGLDDWKAPHALPELQAVPEMALEPEAPAGKEPITAVDFRRLFEAIIGDDPEPPLKPEAFAGPSLLPEVPTLVAPHTQRLVTPRPPQPLSRPAWDHFSARRASSAERRCEQCHAVHGEPIAPWMWLLAGAAGATVMFALIWMFSLR